MKKPMKFEEALAKLEENVNQLERGEIPLDEAIALYEESVGLIRLCGETLEKAEQKVTRLIKSADGGEAGEEEFSELSDEE